MSKQSLPDARLDGGIMKDVLIGGYYNHYKNKPYKVLDIAKHSEDLGLLVIYKTLYKNELGQIWARPEQMFLEKMATGSDRFELLPPEKWPVRFDYFHSHIYYSENSKPVAEKFYQLLKEKFPNVLRLSAMHDVLMGPHPFWMFEADFKAENFMDVIQFLSEHRGELSILIHPLSGNAVLDHTDYAMFLGKKEDLNLSIF
jgi:aromatic ring-cleaving dioxygenase